ncbi:MAG: Rho termination factor N-terminal domain-containing protein [Christensenellales bacterium]
MRAIKITRGTYGYSKGGRLYPKTNKDKAFFVEDAEAERLVNVLNVAEYADTPVATAYEPCELPDTYCSTLRDESLSESESEDTMEEDFESMTIQEVRAYAKNLGISAPASVKRLDLIDAINCILSDPMHAPVTED